MIHAQFENLIDGFGRSHAFHYRVHGFIEQRHQYPVGHKSRRVVDLDGGLLELYSHFAHSLKRLVGRRKAAHDFHQLHHRHRIEKMHANNFSRPVCNRPQFSDGNRRSVGGQNHLRTGNTVEIAE